jgi:hypothetical protein
MGLPRTPVTTAKLLPFVDARLRDLSERILMTDPFDRDAAQAALDILMQLSTMLPVQQRASLHILRQFALLPPEIVALFAEHVGGPEASPVDAAMPQPLLIP